MKQDVQAERIRGQERWRRFNHLRSTLDFQRVRQAGRHLSGRYMSLMVAKSASPEGPARIGFSVSKRVGSAVVRNRVKRRLRESSRRVLLSLPVGWDLVLTAKAPAAEASYATLDTELRALFVRAGMLDAESK